LKVILNNERQLSASQPAISKQASQTLPIPLARAADMTSAAFLDDRYEKEKRPQRVYAG
jgi:hypothetical protein